MAKTQNPVLLLSDAERATHPKAFVIIRGLGVIRPEAVVAASNEKVSLESAQENCALAAHHGVAAVGQRVIFVEHDSLNELPATAVREPDEAEADDYDRRAPRRWNMNRRAVLVGAAPVETQQRTRTGPPIQ